MRLIIPALCFSIVLLISSCQRELDIDLGDDPTPPVIADSTLLKMYVELDTTLPSGSDTTYKVIYTYDNQKRVKEVTILYDQYFERGDYFYSGNDSLPYLLVTEWRDFIDTYRDSVYLFYTNGLVSLDSTIEYNITANQFISTEVASFSAAGNNTFVERRSYDSPDPSPVSYQASGTIFKTYQNGNIVTQDDTSSSQVSPDRPHYQVSYDDKPNPFYKTEIPYPILNKFNVQKNNALEEIAWMVVPANPDYHYQFAYTYRADGYPVSVKSTAIYIQGTSETVKGLFFYTN